MAKVRLEYRISCTREKNKKAKIVFEILQMDESFRCISSYGTAIPNQYIANNGWIISSHHVQSINIDDFPNGIICLRGSETGDDNNNIVFTAPDDKVDAIISSLCAALREWADHYFIGVVNTPNKQFLGKDIDVAELANKMLEKEMGDSANKSFEQRMLAEKLPDPPPIEDIIDFNDQPHFTESADYDDTFKTALTMCGIDIELHKAKMIVNAHNRLLVKRQTFSIFDAKRVLYDINMEELGKTKGKK